MIFLWMDLRGIDASKFLLIEKRNTKEDFVAGISLTKAVDECACEAAVVVVLFGFEAVKK